MALDNLNEPPAGDVLSLRAEPLTAETFRPFGDVVERAGHDHFPINQGMAERYHDLAQVDITATDGRTALGLVRARPETVPVRLRLMERHPLASQAFVALCQRPFVVVVAPAGAPPARDTLCAFVTDGAQGINYHRGVWHHPIIALDETTDFLVVDREGPGDNCEECAIQGQVDIVI